MRYLQAFVYIVLPISQSNVDNAPSKFVDLKDAGALHIVPDGKITNNQTAYLKTNNWPRCLRGQDLRMPIGPLIVTLRKRITQFSNTGLKKCY